MGLDISHETWAGSYVAFMARRKKIALVAGLPPLKKSRKINSSNTPTLWTYSKPDRLLLELDKDLPIKWGCFKPSPLHLLLSQSDCDGVISWKNCKKVADCLEFLIDLVPVEEREIEYSWNWIKEIKKKKKKKEKRRLRNL